MAFNKITTAVVIVLLALGSANALIDGCARYGPVVNATEFCVQCSPGFYTAPNQRFCIACAAGCANCAITGSCTACFGNSTLNNGFCSNCGPNCANCDITGCATCVQGFGKSNEGFCVQCSPNCVNCGSSLTCDVCANGFRRVRDRTDRNFVCIDDDDYMRTLWTWFIGAGMILALLLACLFIGRSPASPTYNPFDGDYARPNPVPIVQPAQPVQVFQQPPIQVVQQQAYNVVPVQTQTYAAPVIATTTPVFQQQQAFRPVPVNTRLI